MPRKKKNLCGRKGEQIFGYNCEPSIFFISHTLIDKLKEPNIIQINLKYNVIFVPYLTSVIMGEDEGIPGLSAPVPSL